MRHACCPPEQLGWVGARAPRPLLLGELGSESLHLGQLAHGEPKVALDVLSASFTTTTFTITITEAKVGDRDRGGGRRFLDLGRRTCLLGLHELGPLWRHAYTA